MTMITTPTVLRFVAHHLDWLAHRPEGPEAIEELSNIVALYDLAIDTNPRMIYAGPCDVCGRDMYATEGRLVVECRPCGITHTLTERREALLGKVMDTLAPASDIARGLIDLGEAVSFEAIRKWAERERLIARGHDLRGRPLYRVGDVVELARHAREKRTA